MNHRIGVALIISIGLSCLVCSSLTLKRPARNTVQQATNNLNELNGKRAKRQILHSPEELQARLFRLKANCARKLGFPASIQEKVLLHEPNPTPNEKCLIECILKGAKLMDDTNKLSIQNIRNIAGMISNKNELVIAIATATAENCNQRVVAKEPCEAAYQINRCIGREINAHRVKIFY